MTIRAEAIERALAPFANLRADDGDTFATYPRETVLRCEVTAGEIQDARSALALPPDPVPGAGVELETTEEERAEWITAYSVETYRIQAMGRLVRDFAKLQAELARLRPLADEAHTTHIEVDIGQAAKLLEASPELATMMNELVGGPELVRVQTENMAFREFADWVDTWTSSPVGSYSVAALDGLFKTARVRLAALAQSQETKP